MATVDSESDERIVNNSTRHQYRILTDAEKDTMVLIKDLGLGLIETIRSATPEGREKYFAIAKVEEAVMWAVKGLTA